MQSCKGVWWSQWHGIPSFTLSSLWITTPAMAYSVASGPWHVPTGAKMEAFYRKPSHMELRHSWGKRKKRNFCFHLQSLPGLQSIRCLSLGYSQCQIIQNIPWRVRPPVWDALVLWHCHDVVVLKCCSPVILLHGMMCVNWWCCRVPPLQHPHPRCSKYLSPF